jgi:hypothetical protein
MNGTMWRAGLLGAVVLLGLSGCGKSGEEERPTLESAGQASGSGPDFAVTEVKGPASVRPGQSFLATVTVCNQGTVTDGTDVELYLSSDTTITPPTPWTPPGPTTDQPLGIMSTQSLNPGQCQTLSRWVSAHVPSEGAWYLGAMADPYNNRPEPLENNNTLAGTRMGVGYKSDFVVTAVKGPASALLNQPFTATVTVCNQGTQADSTDVELYLSSDAVITPKSPSSGPMADHPLGMMYTRYLEPGQCETLSRSLHAGAPSEGAWYLGAVADPGNMRPELLEDNNTLAGTRMGVGSRPDFIVTAVTGMGNVKPGQQFTVSVTVCNQGTQPDSTEVELYLSLDTLITPGMDQPVGKVFAQSLNPEQCRTLSRSVYAGGSSEGPWYLGAVADPFDNRPEFIEDNNALAGAPMGVGYRSDFVVTEVTGPASVKPGQSFTATVTVCNQGTIPDSTDVEFYFSSDAVITPAMPMSPQTDHALGALMPTRYLEPGQCQTLSRFVEAWVPSEGPWYLGAAADPHKDRPEFLEGNNTLAGTRMGVGNRPDFIVTEVTGPVSVKSGQSFTATVTVCNQGTQADSTDVELYFSSDTLISSPTPSDPMSDQAVGMMPTDYLEPGQCQTFTRSVSAWVPNPGIWYLGAAADPGRGRSELIEDNNALAGTRMGVGSRPDFVVTAVKGPASVRSGQQFTATVTVCNQGTEPDSTDVELYFSSDTVITPATPMSPPTDLHLGMMPIGYLSPGQCQTSTLSVSAGVPSEGAWYLGAVADPGNYRPELFEDNNTLAGTRMGVGNRSDFVVTSVVAPTSVRVNQPFTATVTVCNQGTQADSTDVELYFSSDATIVPTMYPGPATDQPLGITANAYLNPGHCQTFTLVVSARVPNPGAWYLGAVADPYNGRSELLEDNNSRVGPLVFVAQ